MAVFLAGQFAAELFLMRVSLLGVIAGSILYLWGPTHLRRLAFPLVLLLLAIPLPALILNQIAFPLQLLASRAGEAVVSAAGIPMLREGNVLILPETKLEVVEACSGIRSLASLLTLGADSRQARRAAAMGARRARGADDSRGDRRQRRARGGHRAGGAY